MQNGDRQSIEHKLLPQGVLSCSQGIVKGDRNTQQRYASLTLLRPPIDRGAL